MACLRRESTVDQVVDQRQELDQKTVHHEVNRGKINSTHLEVMSSGHYRSGKQILVDRCGVVS